MTYKLENGRLFDEHGNCVCVKFFGSEEKARRALKSLKNCSNCSNCFDCSDCSYCSNCSNCSDCFSCAYCSHCSHCSNCSGCSNCRACNDCIDCSDCSHCSNCSDCSNCFDCTDCSNCSGCSNCFDCSDCSNCSRCSNCSGCSNCYTCNDCSDCSNCCGCSGKLASQLPPVPVIQEIHKAVYEAASQPGALDMSQFHSCKTTHCRAGWAVHLAGEPGYALERATSPLFAAMQIYKASGYEISPVRFYDDNEAAMADMKRLAEMETTNENQT